MNNRKWHDCRAYVDKLLESGWSITGRDPLRLEFGRMCKIVRGGCVIDA